MKKCRKCGKEKPLDEFHRRKTSKDGRAYECKSCMAVRRRRHYHVNETVETRKLCRERNKEKRNAYDRRWRAENKDKVLAYRKTEVYKAARVRVSHSRRSRVSERIDRASWENRLDYYGGKCVYCNTENDITIEHRIPISRGGTNLPANLVPACKSCNCKKGTKTETEFKLFLSQEQSV